VGHEEGIREQGSGIREKKNTRKEKEKDKTKEEIEEDSEKIGSKTFWKNLNPADPNEIPRGFTFGVCDIEVKKWVHFLCIGSFYNGKFKWFKDIRDYLDFLTEDEECPDIIFAHFGGIFDFTYLIREILNKKKERKYKYVLKDMIPRGSGLLCFEVDVIDKTNGGIVKKLKFSDSSALLPFGLRSLCESFGVDHQKLEIDYTKITKITPELIKYLEHDCRGQYEVLEKFSNWPLIKRAGMSITMAGQALKVLRLFLPVPVYNLPAAMDEFVRASYVGGRTEIFKPLFESKKTERLYNYDVNSLYPYVMLANKFPTQHISWSTKYDPKRLGFFDAEVEVPDDMYVPPLPLWKEQKDNTKRLLFPTGKFKGRWSTVELEYARSLGVKIHSTGLGVVFNDGEFIFKEFIETLYQMRMDAKEKGDGVTDILTKLLMNSCYGRFGLNTEKEEIALNSFKKGSETWAELDVDGEIWEFCKNKKILGKTFTNVAVAAWVTSCARIHMHKLYLECKDNLYYTDTDSIYTTKKFSNGKKLGELKLEDPQEGSAAACFLLPKTYFVETEKESFVVTNEQGKKVKSNKKAVMKGFDRKKIGKFTFDDFKNALEGDLKRLSVNHDEKFMTFKTSLRKGKLVQMLPASMKQIRSLYNKRIVTKVKGKYDSKPIKLEDGTNGK